MKQEQIKPERWRQVEALYLTALEREASQRAAFLAEVCADDEALRREVESLLRFHDQAGNFIEATALEVAAQLQAESQNYSLIGRRIGPYQFLSLLGVGGMGEVYRALDSRLDREVAIKVLPPNLAQDTEALARFKREAKAVAALSHPNILAIHDFGTEQDVSYAVMELLEGETLRSCLRRSALPWRKAVEIGIALADGLASAHAKGITHRDLKPENIFLTTNSQVKILDFGIARIKQPVVDQTASLGMTPSDSTAPGMVMGTVGYMSPEQLRGEEIDAPSDIFSFGCVFYEMVAGRRAFARPTAAEAMAAILKDELPELAEIGVAIPRELDQIVQRCLEKNPEERFQSARDLAFALRARSSSAGASTPVSTRAGWLQTGAVPTSRPTASIERLLTGINRRRTGALIALALVAIAIAAFAYFSRSGRAIDSLAVLPFVTTDADANAEYLADGLTENLINSMSQLPGMTMIASGSVFRFKAKQPDPQAIGKQFGVSAVLTGRIAQRGESLTINAELINVRDGSRLWGERYERRLADILSVQEELTRHITAELRFKLTDAESRRLGKRHTENTEAYHLYQRGRYIFLQFSPDGIRRGLEYFNQAIALDPNYAPAHAGIGYAYALAASQYESPGEAMARARQASLRALQLDESLPEAHFSLALVKWWADWEWAAAENEFRRALELNPNHATARAVFSDFLAAQERFEEAYEQAGRALKLDPLSIYASGAMGKALYYARDYDRAFAVYQKTLELDPDSARTHRNLGRVLLQQGKYSEAIAELSKAYTREQHYSFLADLGHAYAVAGRRNEARQTLAQLQRLPRQRYLSPVYIAKIHAGLGETDEALKLLRQGYQDRSDLLTWLRVEPTFDPLRSDARFAELLRLVGLVR
ncbi:MAG TPA: protein kinase [Blastocatellia bacterium]|nr:protein kinase [Blastocatellia bacterium]